MKIDWGKFGQIGLDLKRTVVNFAEWTGQSETQNYWKLYWQQRPQRTPWTRRSFSENERKFNSVYKKKRLYRTWRHWYWSKLLTCLKTLSTDPMTLGWGPVRPSPSSFNLENSRAVKAEGTQQRLDLLRGDLCPGQAGGGDHQEKPGGGHAAADWRLEEGRRLGLPVPDLRTTSPDVRHQPCQLMSFRDVTRTCGGRTDTPTLFLDYNHLLPHFPGNF